MKTVAYYEAIKRGEVPRLTTVPEFWNLKQRIDAGKASARERLTWELQSDSWRATVERNGPELKRRENRRRLEIRICGEPARQFYSQEGVLPRGTAIEIRTPRSRVRSSLRSTSRPSCTRRSSSVHSSSSSGDDSSGEPEPGEPAPTARLTFACLTSAERGEVVA
jgi:hypothetical protein